MTLASFQSFDPERTSWLANFDRALTVLTAHEISDVLPLLRFAEQEAINERWAAVMLAYESAPAFDPAITTHRLHGFPLAWAAIFDAPVERGEARAGSYETSPWQARISRESYSNAIDEIRALIRAGETYQVNCTFPLNCTFSGDAGSWYRDLGAAQGAQYCAYLDLGRYKVLSLSPELFFDRTGDKLTVRPMKGTMPRGRWTQEDDEQAARLASCEKNRAENVMIVDLLRNDLGRISRFGSVDATRLFEVERYNTLLQMTSSIESRSNPNVDLVSIMKALFPCGSITGAPKIRTAGIIRQLEPFPRGVYTGAIGLIRPGGDCKFNVAIRTLTIDSQTGNAAFGVGGGITYDSDANSEYDECILKSRFLTEPDREFQLIETTLLEHGQFFLLERHLDRLKSSANYFKFLCNENEIRTALERIRAEHPDGMWKVRLLLARTGAATTNLEELELESAVEVRIALAPGPIDRTNPFLFHKTTDRKMYGVPSVDPGSADEVIFWNEEGEITESSIANVVVVTEGCKWTPPRSSGLLRGTFREELLAQGELREKVIYKDDLYKADSIFLINSVRRWRRAILTDRGQSFSASIPGIQRI